MSRKIKFQAEIMQNNNGSGGEFVLFPYDTEEVFGIKGRVPIKATIDGEPYRGSLMKYGHPQHMLGILKGIREKINKSAGDIVDITIELDTETRDIEAPADLRKALKANKLEAIFDKMAYTHRKEYIVWIEGAKKTETRESRIGKAIEKLQEKKK